MRTFNSGALPLPRPTSAHTPLYQHPPISLLLQLHPFPVTTDLRQGEAMRAQETRGGGGWRMEEREDGGSKEGRKASECRKE